MRHRLPFGDKRKYISWAISASLISSRCDTTACGKVRKKRATAILSSIRAKCIPMQTSLITKPVSKTSLPSGELVLKLTTGTSTKRHESVFHVFGWVGPS